MINVTADEAIVAKALSIANARFEVDLADKVREAATAVELPALVVKAPVRYLALSDVHGLLDRIKYKRGWTFTATNTWQRMGEWTVVDGKTIEPILLIVGCAIEDSTGKFPGPQQLQSSRVMRSHKIDELEQFYEEVWSTVRSLEDHEMREWFKVDDEVIRDPHHPKQPGASIYTESQLTLNDVKTKKPAFTGPHLSFSADTRDFSRKIQEYSSSIQEYSSSMFAEYLRDTPVRPHSILKNINTT